MIFLLKIMKKYRNIVKVNETKKARVYILEKL